MIKSTSAGWIVVSETGKKLGGPFETREEAVRRLRQIEYYAQQNKKKKH